MSVPRPTDIDTPPANQPKVQGLYDDPKLYDILHTPGTAEEVTALERTARRSLRADAARRKRQTWLEPACGTGRYLRRAAARGRAVIGFDLSRAMIDYARAHHPRDAAPGRYSVATMESFVGTACEPASADFAFNPINSVRHLMTDDALQQHLGQVATALRPGGVYAVGLGTTVYGLEPPSEDVWTGARGPCRVTQRVQYEPPAAGARTEHVISHLTIETPTGERHATGTYGLRTYSLEEWHDAVETSAMRIVGVTDMDGHKADAAPMAYRVYVLEARD